MNAQGSHATVARSDVDIANRGAASFIRLYYQAYDASFRMDTVPRFYRPDSNITWNGTPVAGTEELKQFLEAMPRSIHDVQSYDCHPIPGSSMTGPQSPPRPPSLLVTVSGTVRHGPPPIPTPASASGAKRPTFDNEPRVFNQTFILIPDEAHTAGDPKYFVKADSLRFVG
ncbi:NTF2-like protein [Ceratobasidium sp. AG-I]|nr:NTF2-like protein [Ceratobasidium sp. AG-I]